MLNADKPTRGGMHKKHLKVHKQLHVYGAGSDVSGCVKPCVKNDETLKFYSTHIGHYYVM